MRVFNVPYNLLLFAVTTVTILGACLWIVFVNVPILDELDARGERTQAEVIWVGEPYIVFQRGNYSRIGWRVDMRYAYRTRSGIRVEDKKTFVKQSAKYLAVGRKFDLVYLPDRPSVHNSAYGNGYAGTGTIYALLPMAAVCAFMTLHYWRRRPSDWEGPRLWPPFRPSGSPQRPA
ncbi:MAG: DUF3592 domain-containing protein [Pseudomonadota bacterium]